MKLHAGSRCGVVLALFAIVAAGCGGSTTQAPSSAATAAAPTSVASAARTAAPLATPSVNVVDGVSVTSTSLGVSVAPIDVVSAFGSIWVAGHHQSSVIRLDPATLEPIAKVQVGSGPGWFAVTDDALWVNNQMGRGLTRIDPTTNTADVRAGMWPTCGGPLVAAGSIWQMSCDTGRIMRIDQTTYEDTDIAADGFQGLGLVNDRLIAVGPEALFEIDPASNQLTKLDAVGTGFAIGFDNSSVWLAASDGVHRIAIQNGAELGMIPLAGDMALTFAGDRAWLTVFGDVLHEVDTTTTSIKRTLHLDSPAVAREIDGVVWVTSFDANSLSRFAP